MRVLVLGSGGREHALADHIQNSKSCTSLWVSPGNAGMALSGTKCIDLGEIEKNSNALLSFCKNEKIDLVVVGPEKYMLSNIKSELESAGIRCFSPTQKAAKLESSKIFCKNILIQADVPTAQHVIANTAVAAQKVISEAKLGFPLVIKADGLAQGKGVVVCKDAERAHAAARELGQEFGYPLLFEKCLVGRELSAFAMCKGEDLTYLGTACDYKRITPDPFSDNTGGMGAYSPCDFISDKDESQIKEIFKRVLHAMKKANADFEGFLFAGLMKTQDGIFVLEFNVRMGDPETQALFPLFEGDFLFALHSLYEARPLSELAKKTGEKSVHVVCVSEGYPTKKMNLGHRITFEKPNQDHVKLYFSGVQIQGGELLNSGGRVLGVTALSESKASARKLAYSLIENIKFAGMYFRKDVAE